MNPEQRIKLAEAIYDPDAEVCPFDPYSFDPENDANDTEAVIRWLESHPLKPTVTVTFGRGVRFQYYHGTYDELETDNWKAGVCELAIKVIDDE